MTWGEKRSVYLGKEQIKRIKALYLQNKNQFDSFNHIVRAAIEYYLREVENGKLATIKGKSENSDT